MNIIYDPSLNTIPTSQGMLTIIAIRTQEIIGISIPVEVNITENLVANGVQIDTDENDAEYSGFINYTYDPVNNSFVKVNNNSITLNSTTGYTIEFDLSPANSEVNARFVYSLVCYL